MENSVLIDRYRKWVIQRGTETFPVTENEEGNLEVESKFALGRVNFYEDDIVELRIDMIRDNTTEFFLHFQLKDLKRAQDLYVEMEEAMRSLKDRQVVHIVLSCTSGLTTSYYAELLNAASKTLNLNYEFKAVSYNRLESEMHGKDMLLLAPQVHFERKKLQEKYPNVLVRNIPAQTFGKYDTGTLIEMIKGELQDEDALKTPKQYEHRRSLKQIKKYLLQDTFKVKTKIILFIDIIIMAILCAVEKLCVKKAQLKNSRRFLIHLLKNILKLKSLA